MVALWHVRTLSFPAPSIDEPPVIDMALRGEFLHWKALIPAEQRGVFHIYWMGVSGGMELVIRTTARVLGPTIRAVRFPSLAAGLLALLLIIKANLLAC
jgi:hypothetical protein